MKGVFTTLLLVALVLCSSPATTFFQTAMATDLGTCDAQCGSRCAKAGVKDRCLKYCGVCCTKCKCVPSGTYGNKHECPCYRDLKNTKGKPKCP